VTRIEEHVLRAHQLEDLARRYDAHFQKDRAWTLVLCFYAAMHMLEAALRADARPCRDHEQRRRELKGWADATPKLQSAYKWLFDKSQDARYTPGYQPGSQDLTVVWSKLKCAFDEVAPALRKRNVDPSPPPPPPATPPPP
jgi:hypothetical protein